MALGGFGAPSWQVESGQRVGAFVLGMGVNQALAIVQSMGCLEKGGMLSFDDHRLFDVDLSLRLPPLGLQLCFDSFRQDLRVICVNLKPEAQESALGLDQASGNSFVLPLTYVGKPFAGKQNSTLREICNMIGPTYLGDFKCEHGQACYILKYPGLAFEFPLPVDDFAELAERRDHPYELPAKNGIEQAPPIASRMWVYAKASNSWNSPASAWLEEPQLVVVRPGVGLELNGKILRFGSMPQDVFSDFGPPDQACGKTRDSVRIHSVSKANTSISGPDYYYNYFQLGFDVLFDGCTHLVKKMVLHTNPPTHESFSRYSRCFFQIPIAPPSYLSESNVEAQMTTGTASECGMPEFTLEGAFGEAFEEDANLHANDNDTEAVPLVAPCLQDDAVHGMQPAHQNVSRFALPFTDDWRARLESKLAERGVTTEEARLQTQIYDCEGEIRVMMNLMRAKDGFELEADRFPLSVVYPVLKQSTDAVDDAENTEEAGSGSRRMSKRERKAARKKGNRQDVSARAPTGSPLLQGDTSPDLSFSSASPSPSPLLSQLASMAENSSSCAHDTIACGGDDLDLFADLPPPAVPIEFVEEVSSPDGYQPHIDAENQSSTLGAIDHNASSTPPIVASSDVLEAPECVARSARMLQTLAEGGRVGVDWAWPEIQELLHELGISCRKPLVVDKGSQSPFGSTHFYAIPGLVFEVMHNEYLASLTVFNVPLNEMNCERLILRDFV